MFDSRVPRILKASMNHRRTLAAVFALVMLWACSSDSRPAPTLDASANPGVEAQIEDAVRKHLSRRSDLDVTAMDMKIQKVDVEGESADAVVGFQVKDQPEAAMSMNYHLVRLGGEWVVQPAAS